ncbi:uroporphyrinogen-III synthase-like isoform X2 [Rhodnius prolixus]|uniref:uroporphyrinogen-III synthase-like isoform X2 n=1 Tax=Rhodnius prolixus TaxID=13249 RepID=UPI003D18F247
MSETKYGIIFRSSDDVDSGIIFSSPRCVKAVSMAADDITKWENHRIFVVGEKTGKLVETDLGLRTEGGSSGNAKALAEYILKQDINKPLLLPCGNLSRETLSKTLNDGGIKFDRIVVYTTITNPNVESNIKEVFDKLKIRYILYFSPSAVNVTFPIFTKLGLDLDLIKWAAIGPTTESELLKHSVQVTIVAESPTPEHFAAALERSL